MEHRERKQLEIGREARRAAHANYGWLMIMLLMICVATLGFILIQLNAMTAGALGGFPGGSWQNSQNNDLGGKSQAGQNSGQSNGAAGSRDGWYGKNDTELPLICVDAGHGFDDPGAMHTNLRGLDEKDITLDIALQVAELLKENGYPVMMTRESDEVLSWMKANEDGLYVMDPYDRCDIANEAEVDLFISIHCNALPSNSAVRGMQLYYTEGHTADNPDYVEAIAGSMAAAFGERPKVVANPENDSYVVNRLVNAPSVLVETGFITNASDAKLMLSADWRRQMAESLAEGICNFLEAEQ